MVWMTLGTLIRATVWTKKNAHQVQRLVGVFCNPRHPRMGSISNLAQPTLLPVIETTPVTSLLAIAISSFAYHIFQYDSILEANHSPCPFVNTQLLLAGTNFILFGTLEGPIPSVLAKVKDKDLTLIIYTEILRNRFSF